MFTGFAIGMGVLSVFVLPMIFRGSSDNVNEKRSLPAANSSPVVSASFEATQPQQVIPVSTNGEMINQVLNLEPNKEVILPNKIQGDGTHNYTFQARKGQSINTSINNSQASMSILDARGVPLNGAANVPSSTISIPEDGAYIIQLKGTPNNVTSDYQLVVNLQDLSIPSPPVTNTPTSPTTPTSPATATAPPSEPPAPQIEIKIRR